MADNDGMIRVLVVGPGEKPYEKPAEKPEA